MRGLKTLIAILAAGTLASPLYAMGPSSGDGSGGGFFASFGIFIPIFLIMYLLVLRPQQKKQKAHKKLLSELKKGDRVVTSGGMFGDIFAFNEKRDSVVLKVGEMKLEFLRSSIAGRAQE